MAAIVYKTKYDYGRIKKRVRNADGSESPAPAAGSNKLLKIVVLAAVVLVGYKLLKK